MVGKSLRDHLRIWKILFIRSLSISLQCLYRQWDTGILALWQKPHLPVSLLHLFVQSTLHSLVQSRPRLPTPLRIAHCSAQSYHRLLLGSFTHFQIDCNTNLSSSEGITTKKSPSNNLQDGGLSGRQRLLYCFQ